MIPLSIPSPPLDWAILFQIGPLKVHTYAVAIIVGGIIGVWIATKRWVARGGDSAAIEAIVIWAVPLGILGGRLYHVVSSPAAYFGPGGHPLDAFKVWEGGLGIWGAIALGTLGAYIGARRAGVSWVAFMDAAAPGILVAQAIGRIGNYFNQELFGGPTTLPWGLQIDPYQPNFPGDYPVGTLFHPTFLYELLWNLAGAALIIALDRRFRFRHGRTMWLYVLVYTTGRLWIEALRIDDAVHIGGVRINVWVSILVMALAIVMFARLGKKYRDAPYVEFPAAVAIAPALPVATKAAVPTTAAPKAGAAKTAATKKPASSTTARKAPGQKKT